MLVPDEEFTNGRHRRLYEENLVYNIMLATAYYVKDLLEDNPELDDDDVYDFVDENYGDIIEESLEEFHKKGGRLPNDDDDDDEDDEADAGEEENDEDNLIP